MGRKRKHTKGHRRRRGSDRTSLPCLSPRTEQKNTEQAVESIPTANREVHKQEHEMSESPPKYAILSKGTGSNDQFSTDANSREMLKSSVNSIASAWTQVESESTERQEEIQPEQESKLNVEQEAMLYAEQEAKLEAEQEVKLKEEREAERETKLEAAREAKLEAEREAKLKAEREAKLKAEREAKLEAEREAKLKAEREAKLKAEREAKLKAEREAKLEAEREAKLKAQREAEESQLKELQAKQKKLRQAKTLCDHVMAELRNTQTRAGDPQSNWRAASRMFALLASAASVSLSFAQAEPNGNPSSRSDTDGTGRPDSPPSPPILCKAWSRAVELRGSAVAALDRVTETLMATIATAREELSSPTAMGSGKTRGELQHQINAAKASVLDTLMGGPAPSAITTEAVHGSPDHQAVAAWARTHAQLRERCSALLDEATALVQDLKAAEEQVWAELQQAGADLEQQSSDAEAWLEANSKAIDGHKVKRGSVTLEMVDQKAQDLQAIMDSAKQKGVGQNSRHYRKASVVLVCLCIFVVLSACLPRALLFHFLVSFSVIITHNSRALKAKHRER